MSTCTLPLLFINLGGEMLYILDQRLRAQTIPVDKARKVMNDIISTMFTKRFMEELLKPQELYSKKALRTVFDRLAHASIMRLNAASMDKLYDLMTMALKYQVFSCVRPRDLLMVTLNHVDAVRAFVRDSPAILATVDDTFRHLIEIYSCLSAGEFQLIRQTLLSFFQDMHIRVSIFLKDKVQSSNGRFVLPTSGPVPLGTENPGTIRLFAPSGEALRCVGFPVGGAYSPALRDGSCEIYGERVITLGTNMYSTTRSVDTDLSGATKACSPHAQESSLPNLLAKEELNLLAHLMGGSVGVQASGSEFKLMLFNSEREEEEALTLRSGDSHHRVINIDAAKSHPNQELQRIMGGFSDEGHLGEATGEEGAKGDGSREPSSKGEELLAMMDAL
ncbi:protein OSCP1 [Lampetra fluviatilis]